MPIVSVIGSGFAGLSAAAYLAAEGYHVNVYEKNATPGGRARTFSTGGYSFDMGPSWYWMPAVFERFFNDFGYKVEDLYDLQQLNPSFEMVFEDNQKLMIPGDYRSLRELFESIEKGSSERLDEFMREAAHKYNLGVEQLIYKPGLSLMEFADPALLKPFMSLSIFSSFSRHIRKYFSDPKLIALMEFPVLFLGAMPSQTPALYSLMNYAGLKLGTWYPKGGFGKVIEAMMKIAAEKGCNFFFNTPVDKIECTNNKVKGLIIDGKALPSDAIVAAADYHHVEDKLLPPSYRNYTDGYWQTKTFAPSCLVFYVGLTTRLPSLQHHTLFFDESLDAHSKQIYKEAAWPAKPLFYVCCPSRSDDTVSPAGHENLFFLMPIAPGLEDSPEIREKYFRIMLQRLEKHTGHNNLQQFIDFKRSYCISDFIRDYNSYKGNAYGLANTLKQTAILKPKIRNKKLRNLFYAGQLTVPGPGVPPSLVSGKLASDQVHKYFKSRKHEVDI